ncbi:MAG TPA: NADP-dependent phosphogluconate dehydrogenase [Deltaproteobacteria bacterium]|nr:NADP-dependent phosphogluconate dehydrogenase [Deltaproteobacteria bacterium]
MGANLARNLHSHDHTVAVHNRNPEVLEAFIDKHGDPRFIACPTPALLVATLKRPRVIVLMVTAGRAVDAVLEGLIPLLEPGDIVVDGGNSHFPDTERRVAQLADRKLRFVGMGVSGGEEGALLGPSMMPGGDASAWEILQPLLEPAAAVADTGPCIAWCGSGGAGHFVKMVHNGIEYGDMQLIAEVWTLMVRGMELAPAAVRGVFEQWNAGRLRSFLIEITAGIVAAADPAGGGLLVDQILDVAGQKGTGRWTAIDAIEGGIPLSTVVAAVEARALSALPELRRRTADAITAPPGSRITGLQLDDLERALYASKIMSYTQGFALLRARSMERGYGTDLAEVARIWKAGCIIRAEFLDRVHDAFHTDPDLPLLTLDPGFASEVSDALSSWRRVTSAAISAGIPIPALSSSLAYLDTLRTARGSAALIQAQRDWFGAHTYRRVDDPQTPIHTDWGQLEQL